MARRKKRRARRRSRTTTGRRTRLEAVKGAIRRLDALADLPDTPGVTAIVIRDALATIRSFLRIRKLSG